MPDNVVTIRGGQQVGNHVVTFTDYVVAALTTGNAKKEWIIPFYCRIIDVIVTTEGTGGVGTDNTILDVNRNGTTIYTDQDNRPAKRPDDTGQWRYNAAGLADRGYPDIVSLLPGDVLSYDIDQINATSGATRTVVSIVCEAQ